VKIYIKKDNNPFKIISNKKLYINNKGILIYEYEYKLEKKKNNEELKKSENTINSIFDDFIKYIYIKLYNDDNINATYLKINIDNNYLLASINNITNDITFKDTKINIYNFFDKINKEEGNYKIINFSE
jgi:hypothetical protein